MAAVVLDVDQGENYQNSFIRSELIESFFAEDVKIAATSVEIEVTLLVIVVAVDVAGKFLCL